MKERLIRAAVAVDMIALLCTFGLAGIYIATLVFPFDEWVRATHGLVGFIYGMAFLIGMVAGNVAVWIILGDGPMRILGDSIL